MSDLTKRVTKLLAKCLAEPGWWGVEIAHGKAKLVDRWGGRWGDVELTESEAMKGRARGRKLEDALRVIRDQQTHIALLEAQLAPHLVYHGYPPVGDQGEML